MLTNSIYILKPNNHREPRGLMMFKTKKEEESYYRALSTPPILAYSVDDVNNYLKHCVDLRKVILVNDLDAFHNLCCGTAVRQNTKSFLTLPQYKILKCLIPLIQHQNLIVAEATDVSKALCVRRDRIKEKLDVVQDHIQLLGGCRTGTYKILINPNIAYRYEGSWLNSSRSKACSEYMNNVIRGVQDYV